MEYQYLNVLLRHVLCPLQHLCLTAAVPTVSVDISHIYIYITSHMFSLHMVQFYNTRRYCPCTHMYSWYFVYCLCLHLTLLTLEYLKFVICMYVSMWERLTVFYSTTPDVVLLISNICHYVFECAAQISDITNPHFIRTNLHETTTQHNAANIWLFISCCACLPAIIFSLWLPLHSLHF